MLGLKDPVGTWIADLDLATAGLALIAFFFLTPARQHWPGGRRHNACSLTTS